MKPLKLTMSAFGSYGSETEIDFSLLNGLYIITGDTGAGKTTIFDAITFALYGEVSGSVRDVSMLRSDFAADDMPTFVKFEFTYGGKIYKIERTPSYKKQNRKSPISASAYMEMPDGRVISGVKEVTKEITDILGIDKNQFTQIAMIAQGDFLKLLLADTDERGKIFRKIFNTDFYFNFRDKLKNALKEIKDKKELLEYSITNTCARAENAEPPSSIGCADEFPQNLTLVINSDKELNESLQKELQNFKRKTDKERSQLAVLKDKFSLIDADPTAAADSDTLKMLETSAKKGDICGEMVLAQKQLNKEIDEYKLISASERRLAELNKERETYKIKLEELLSQLSELQSQNSGEHLKRLSDEKLNREKLLNKSQALKSELDNINKISEKITLYHNTDKKLKAEQAAYITAEKAFKDASISVIDAEDMFLREQAGIIASHLEDNKPCPVCGSCSHPSPAALAENAPSEKEIKALKEQAKKLENEKNNISKTSAELFQALELYKKEILTLTDTSDVIHAEQSLKSKKADIAEETVKLQNEIKLAEKSISDCMTAINKQKADEKQAENLKVSIEKLKESDIELKIKSEETRLSEIRRHLTFETYEKARENLNNISLKLSQIKSALRQLISEHETRLYEYEKEMKSVQKSQNECTNRLKNNRKILKEIETLLKEYKEICAKFSDLNILSKTVCGELKGSSKIAFEQYIQGVYFEKIINEANKRFYKMTGGRYELIRRTETYDKRGKSGLDLDVIDNYTGKTRSVRSLSGGESFKASLSLALGMSDVIQYSSGGVHIESMFVDEGFGALDDESLDQAVEILSELTLGDRTVGIISHVSELKERIDKKIAVSKNTDGSSVCHIEIDGKKY